MSAPPRSCARAPPADRRSASSRPGIRRDLGPDAERCDDCAAERLRVRDGALVRHRDERPRAGARAERRARRSPSPPRTARAHPRRPPRPGRGTRRRRRRRAGRRRAATRNPPRASRPLGTATTSGPAGPSSDASHNATRDVVRGAVPARDDTAHAVRAEQRRDLADAGRVRRALPRETTAAPSRRARGRSRRARRASLAPSPGHERRSDHAPVGPEPGADDREWGSARVGEQRLARAARRAHRKAARRAEASAEARSATGRARSRGRRARLPRRRGRVDDGRVRRDRRARPRRARARRPGERRAARDAAPPAARRARSPRRVRPRTGVRRRRDRRSPRSRRSRRGRARRRTRAEARLRERGRPQVGLDDHARSLDRGGRVEVAPVDRVRARRPTGEVDELAQPDPHRQRSAAELRGELGAVGQHCRAAALGARRHLTALQDGAGLQIDDAGGDLRPADVDPERDGHLLTAARAAGPAFGPPLPSLYSLVSAARAAAPSRGRECEQAPAGSVRPRRRRAARRQRGRVVRRQAARPRSP